MTSELRVLLVEGRDDKHVIYSLAQHYSVPEVFSVKDAGGVENLLQTLPVQLKGSGIERVGVILDADEDLQSRWDSLKAVVENAGYPSLPRVLDKEGLVVQQEGFPVCGAWLMPDNELPGMLENFVAFLVPADDNLYALAKSAVDEIDSVDRKFIEAHIHKAYIHTWLAWQKDPGTPLGLAITKKYLDANLGKAQVLADWLMRLFN